MLLALLLAPLAVQATPGAPAVAPSAAFQRIVLTSDYLAEGVAAGDLDRDGDLDVVVGPLWFEGPDFTTRHELGPVVPAPLLGYASTFFSFCEDVDLDGWVDVVQIGLPGSAATWARNPAGARAHWARTTLFGAVGTESPLLVDLDGDGTSELLCASVDRLGYAERVPGAPGAPWTFHPITAALGPLTFLHGLGAGDVDGDGDLDVLTAFGWLEQPASLAGDPLWAFHSAPFGLGGAQMFVDDVDGDGDGDVVTSLAAHGYGLSWFERVPRGPSWIERKILPAPNGLSFSQLHGLALADVDGDGLRDIVAGKTYLAHNGADPGALDPAVLYAFLLRRQGGRERYEPLLLDADSGVGRQVLAADVTGDGRTDVVVANKKGAFVFRQM